MRQYGVNIAGRMTDSADDWAFKGLPDSIMLAKPFAPVQLVTAVAQLLNGGPAT